MQIKMIVDQTAPILRGTPAELTATMTRPEGFKFLLVNVSRLCNHRCPFCWTSESLRTVKRQCRPAAIDWLDDRLMLALLKAFKDKGGAVVATMSDGEPLLDINYEFMTRLAATSGKLDLSMLVFTNGQLLIEKTISELTSLNPRISFCISVNAGSEKAYDKAQGVEGAFRKVMKNKRAWAEFDKTNLTGWFHRAGIHTIVSADTTEKEMTIIKQLVMELGRVPWIVSTLGIAGNARINQDIMPQDFEKTKRLIDKHETGPTARDPIKNNCSYIVSEWHENCIYGITIHPFNGGAVQPCPYLSSFGSGLWFSLKEFVEQRRLNEENLQKEVDKWLDYAVLITAIITTAAFKLAGYEYCVMRHKNAMTIEAFLTAFNYEMMNALRNGSATKIGDKNYLIEMTQLSAKTAVDVARFRFGKNISIDIDRIKESTGLKYLPTKKAI